MASTGFRILFLDRKLTMKTAILASLVASAVAFAPSKQQSASTSLSGSFDDALGVQKPLGFWYVADETVSAIMNFWISFVYADCMDS